jgi:uncharacterized C2H2 Zn-finger protein
MKQGDGLRLGDKIPQAVGIAERAYPSGKARVKCPRCGTFHEIGAYAIQGATDADGNFLFTCDECGRRLEPPR